MQKTAVRRPMPLGRIFRLSLAQAFTRTAAIRGPVSVGEIGPAEWQVVVRAFVLSAAVLEQVQVGQFDRNPLAESFMRAAAVCGQMSMGKAE